MKKSLSLFLVSFLLVGLAGCASNFTRSTRSQPLSNLLEPVKESRQIATKTPLTLPTSVAIIMAPNSGNNAVPNTTLRLAAEKLKQQLLINPKYVSAVAIVAIDDIQNKLSLDKIRELYATDIAIVVSHQQDQRSTQSGPVGLLDLTIVGAFTVPGVETKTSTVIDGRVIHIPSNAIIFTKSGTDERSAKSTTYAQESVAREASINSLTAAVSNFGDALVSAMSKFDNYDLSQAVPLSSSTGGSDARKNEKAANDYWSKVDTYKSGGGGSMGFVSLILCAGAVLVAWRRK